MLHTQIGKAILNAHPNLTIRQGLNMVRQHGYGLIYNPGSNAVFSSGAHLISASWTARRFS